MTEVRVTDARYRDVHLPDNTNTGSIDLPLPPGVYQVAFRRGGGWSNHLVVLQPGEDGISITEPAWPAEQAAAEDDDESGPFRGTDTPDIGIRVSLDKTEGPGANEGEVFAQIVKVDGHSTDIVRPITLSPGSRSTRMRLPAHAGVGFIALLGPPNEVPDQSDRLELPVVAVPGWRTRVDLFIDAWASRPRWDPARTLVSLVPLEEKERGSGQLGKIRNALTSLAGRRTLNGPALRGLIEDWLQPTFDNPMLAIYAAHLLPCTSLREAFELESIATRLLSILHGPQGHGTLRHPDVQALRLRAALQGGSRALDAIAPFDAPPALAASWEALTLAAQSRPDLVPRGSMTAEFASRSFVSGPWRVWQRPRRRSDELVGTVANRPEQSGGQLLRHLSVAPDPRIAFRAETVAEPTRPAFPAGRLDTFDQQRELIFSAFAQRDVRAWYRQITSEQESLTDADEAEPLTASGDLSLSSTERALVAALNFVAKDEARQATFNALRIASQRGDQPRLEATHIATRLGLPVTSVEDAAEHLASTLLVQAQRGTFNLGRTPMTSPTLIIPYDPAFLGDGFTVPMPKLSESLKAQAFGFGLELPYTHYSLVMHARRRVAIVAANNIDAAHKVQIAGGLSWHMDERVGEFQLGAEVYANNQLDRGHMVRREDVCWGSVTEAKRANESTFFYANAAPQHQNFNQDEWVTLEDWVLDRATDFSYRLCVFTGPVLRENDPTLSDLPPGLRTAFNGTGPAQIPAAFWKVVVLRDATAGGEDLSVVAFAMRQSEMWDDHQGRQLLHLKVHQVTLQAIESWTGLDFGDLRQADELRWSEERTRLRDAGNEPEWPQIQSGKDIVFNGPARRLRGLRAVRNGAAAQRSVRAVPSVASDCGCAPASTRDFDARAAIEALNRDVVQLTGLLAQRDVFGTPPAADPIALPGTRSAAGVENTADAVAVTNPAQAAHDAAVIAATSPDQRAAMADFLRWTRTQSNIARGIEPPPTASEFKRIIGGTEVGPNGFPSCVCIGTAEGWQCTGVLVAQRVVLTAAHCGGAITRVMVNGNTVTPWVDGKVIAVRKVVVHPRYARQGNENDITVLILDEDANVFPVGLASAAQLGEATSVKLVGFGYNDSQRPLGFGTKRHVDVQLAPIVDREGTDLSQLEQLLGFHRDYEFVAGRKGLGIDTCNGDSGGPAYVPDGPGFLLAGLTSRSTFDAQVNCGDGGIYVRPERFLDWINSTLGDAGIAPLQPPAGPRALI